MTKHYPLDLVKSIHVYIVRDSKFCKVRFGDTFESLVGAVFPNIERERDIT